MNNPDHYVTWREFEDFRTTMREEYRFIRNLLLTTLGAALLSGIASSIFVVVRGSA